MMWDLSGGKARRHHHGQSHTTSQPTPSFPVPQPNAQPGASGQYPSSSYPPAEIAGGPTMQSSYPPPSPANDQLQSYIQTSRGQIIYSGPAPQVIQLNKKSKLHKHHHHSKHHHSSSSKPQIIVFGGSSPAAPQIQYATSQGQNQVPQVSPVYVQTQSQPQPVSSSALPFPQPSYVQAPAMPQDLHQADGQPLDSMPFEYSKCTGRRKALCIGINYLQQPNELRGCINDARRVRDFLMRYHRYKKEDIVLLTDDSEDPRSIPTRDNILRAMRWLVRTAKRDDSLFFHYSGHGGQTPDQDGDEVDGLDEVIYPVDFRQYGHIVDDIMHDIMVKPLPSGCRLTALFDCCHSGTALDLPYIYSSRGRLKGNQVTPSARRRKYSPADVISFSGCEDGQTSADTFAGGVAVGAMSHAFITSLRNQPRQSYHGLLRSVREILYPKYSQKPQLGSSHPINTGLDFII